MWCLSFAPANMRVYHLKFNVPFISFCLLNVIAEAAASVIPENFINSESGECKIVNEHYWSLVEWFYGQLNIVHVSLIVESRADKLDIWPHDELLQNILKSNFMHTLTFNVIDLNSEASKMSYVNTFSWQGNVFEKRKNQSTEIVSRRKRAAYNSVKLSMKLKHDVDAGEFIIASKISTIDEFLTGSARKPFLIPRRLYVIAITNTNEPQFDQITMNVLEKLWKDYGIANL